VCVCVCVCVNGEGWGIGGRGYRTEPKATTFMTEIDNRGVV